MELWSESPLVCAESLHTAHLAFPGRDWCLVCAVALKPFPSSVVFKLEMAEVLSVALPIWNPVSWESCWCCTWEQDTLNGKVCWLLKPAPGSAVLGHPE